MDLLDGMSFFDIKKDEMIEHIDSNGEYNPPPRTKKRQRIEDSMKSALFSHKSDHQEFLEIFRAIEKSEIIKTLSISHDINKEIAEYATGQLLECQNAGCGQIIHILYEDCDWDDKIQCPGCNKDTQRRCCSECKNRYMANLNQPRICPRCEDELCFECQEKSNKCIACDALHCKYCMKNQCECCEREFCEFYDEIDGYGKNETNAKYIVGGCSICGGIVCQDCISMPELVDIKGGYVNNCICNDCFKKHKDIFKHKKTIYFRYESYSE